MFPGWVKEGHVDVVLGTTPPRLEGPHVRHEQGSGRSVGGCEFSDAETTASQFVVRDATGT